MADVFISYKRRLRPRVAELAAALEQLKVSVWFDVEIEPGKSFGAVINRELADARCVLVCWTPDAFAPEHGDEISWVEAEATKGRERKILVPVLFEQTMLNAPWNMLQTENLVSWTPDSPPTGAWLGVLAGVGKFVQRPGLADFVRTSSSGSAAELTRWAQTYPDDPLAAGVWEHITELEIAAAKARVEASRAAQPKPLPPLAPPAAPLPRSPAPPPLKVAEPLRRAPSPSPSTRPGATTGSARASPKAASGWRGWALGFLIAGSLYLAYGLVSLFVTGSTTLGALANLAVSAALLAGAWFQKQRQG